MIDMSADSEHVFNLDMLEEEKIYCQNEILNLYNHGTINEREVSEKLTELKVITKKAYDAICEFHNLTSGFYWSGESIG